MRKIFILIVCILSLDLFFTPLIWANDGSLKIDLNIEENNEKNEQTYIEQNPELSKLFSDTLSQRILQQQQLANENYAKENTHIFLAKGQSLNTVSTEKLFVGYQQNIDSAKIGVTLSEKVAVINWRSIVLVIIASVIMILSILPLIRRKDSAYE